AGEWMTMSTSWAISPSSAGPSGLTAHGFGRVKGIGARIDTLLTGATAAVAAARIVDIRFLRAKADRGVGVDRRRMRLTYRVVLEPAAT
ncbi:MAG: hypothetical protein AAFV09_09815, partial [Pseudomonadota bacterium]